MKSGQIIDERYEIVNHIGSGGMADVYLGYDPILARDVAIKFLRVGKTDAMDATKRFEREALSVSELNHPNVVSLFDVGEDEEGKFIVMEYVDGLDLKAYIRENHPIPVDIIQNLMIQILSGVQAAHNIGIVHRDLKPQNIMVNHDGTIKIMDFGIAMVTSETSITQTNSIIGSVHYLSPEQARGSMATSLSDIYALGVVLFEMLTGRVPFDGESAVSIALKHFQEPLPPIEAYRDDVPQSLMNVVAKATAKEPSARYQTAQEMIDDLETVFSDNRKNEPVFVPANMANETIVMAKEDIENQMRLAESDEEQLLAAGEKAVDDDTDPGTTDENDEDTVLDDSDEYDISDKGGLAASAGLAGAALAGQGTAKAAENTGSVDDLHSEPSPTTSENSSDNGDGNQPTSQSNQKVGKASHKQPKSRKPLAIIAGVIVGLILIAFLGFNYMAGRNIAVPDLAGMTEQEASLTLESLDLVLGDVTEVYDEEVEVGRVINSSPSANTEVKHDTAVDVNISKGPEPYEVKDYTGQPFTKIEKELTALGFTVTQEEDYSDSVEAGNILSQSIEQGEAVIPGETTINFVVSAGVETFTMADLSGWNRASIQQYAESNGLIVSFDSQYSGWVPDGVMISQSITPGTEFVAGDELYIVMSDGPEPVSSSSSSSSSSTSSSSRSSSSNDDNDEDDDESSSSSSNSSSSSSASSSSSSASSSSSQRESSNVED
ncbi:protein kinase domain-containing protein [Aerococcus urinaeequi]|uniref:non-specific serine/threonine protein kinase n=1 Tax=Aerococcus viridans TaxID=1377 RepID=A0A2N6UFS2_9LACT|nr:PASTA domain-containing protein [Aerococcus viridans]PMC80364.1 serine/threonine-protein kinase [Aerococcus viridans]